MSTFRDRIQNIQTELSTLADEVSGIPQPGPGIAPPGPATTSWLDNPGEPVTPGVTCYDNPTEAKRYASQGFDASGVQQNAPQDFPAAQERARKLLACQTPDEREAIIKGAGPLDNDTAAVAVLTGYALGGGGLGSPYLMLGPVSLAKLIRKPGAQPTWDIK